MRAISIRQPWLCVILHGPKRIENRRTDVVGAYRGPVLLHASGYRGSVDGYEAICAEIRGLVGHPHVGPPSHEMVERGGILGRAWIVDVRPPAVATDVLPRGGGDLIWWERDCFGIVLADVEPLPFVPLRGQLGLFNVPDDYAERSDGAREGHA